MARILMVVRAERGGEFGHVVKLARELPRHGHQVAVCGPHSARAERLGVEVYDVPMIRQVRPLADARAVAGVIRAVRDFKPDLIHAHGSKGGVLARVARLAYPRTPVIYSPHQYGFVNHFGHGQRTMYKLIERAMAPMTSRVLAVCEVEAEQARQVWVGGRARTVHNGIIPLTAPEVIDPRIKELAARGPLVAVVAELHQRKGLMSLLDAWPAVLERYPAANVAIAGTGPEHETLTGEIANRGLVDSVHLLGEIDGVAGLLEAATVFLNPAWAEAFPYAVIEAMSMAKPIVATDVGGTREAIIDGEVGLLIAPQDPAAMSAALVRMLDDPGEAVRLGSAAAERMRQRFTLAAMIEGTLGVYGEVGIEPGDPGSVVTQK